MAKRTAGRAVLLKDRSTASFRPATSSDLSNSLTRFTEALAIIRVVARALDADERGTEASALHSGLAALDQVYPELDRLDLATGRAQGDSAALPAG